MFDRLGSGAARDAQSRLDAVDRSFAVIEFDADGTICGANENSLRMLGYALDEIKGRHHSMFVKPADRESAAYRDFWASLRRGETQASQYLRLAKGGRKVWIEASYNPIRDRHGKTTRIVTFATDITAVKIKSLEDAGRIAAIARAQAVAEFGLDGTISAANANFLAMIGYSQADILGKHHRMLVDPACRDSAAYAEFWSALNRGEPMCGEYKRIGKDGREVWILASYNPILNEAGKPFKIVEFATDVTERKLTAADRDGQLSAIVKSQAVIEFAMDGRILKANDNFLETLGYTLPEIQGQYHSMFVSPDERDGGDYAEFWAQLRQGHYRAGEFRRIAKNGREVWIQASYNPIFDLNGKPSKIVKFAIDTTAQVQSRLRSEQVCATMESVAAGAEELSASVREISEAMVKSRQTASDAVTSVMSANDQANRLSLATDAMGGVVQIISDITGQINLLALNATIESARAGEAGKGFAVVASEVKTLAGQVKQAADKIDGEIESLNGISRDVVAALNGIGRAIEAVNEYVTTTAAAVEEQSAVTTEMSASMQRAAQQASGRT